MIDKLCIIGIGLIGGSLARALRDAGSVREIIGYGRSVGNLQQAVELGVIDRAEVSLPDAVLGLATGSSPLAVYDELTARHERGDAGKNGHRPAHRCPQPPPGALPCP